MATSSSLRALLDPALENRLLIGAAGTVLAAAMATVFLGPVGLVLLALIPIDLAMAVSLNRRRGRLRDAVRGLAQGAGRGVATVENAADTGEVRAGQRARHVQARVQPVTGVPFVAEANVFWTAAAPGTWGIAAWADPHDVLLYFADGPADPAELERALNRETGQPSREAVLDDDPLQADGPARHEAVARPRSRRPPPAAPGRRR